MRRSGLRILRHGASSGFHDYAAGFTWRSWSAGWFLRVVAQVIFYALIGRLLGTDEDVRYLLVGNAVVLAAVGSLIAVAGTTWERRAGTFPLLVACPTAPALVFAARNLVFAADGVLISVGALLIVAPIFDVSLPWAKVPLAVLLIVLVALSAYGFGTFLGALVLRAMALRNVVGNLAQMTLLAIAGVNVPVSFFPAPVEWLAQVLPVTHGLAAIRALLAGGGPAEVLGPAAAEAAVGLGWFLLSLVAFGRLAEAGRRDGSIEFAT